MERQTRGLLTPLLFTLTLLSGCGSNFGFPGAYRIDVEQGNIVTPEMVEQLKPGMSRRQVRFVMGTPLVEDTFNPDRWDYHYVKRNGTDTLSQSQLTVFFDGDKLVDVAGSDVPEWAQEATSAASDDTQEDS